MPIIFQRLQSQSAFMSIEPRVFQDEEYCKTCPRFREVGRAVYSEGSPSSSFIFIGREPGEQEVENNQPFYPKAPGGRLFMEYLQQLGITRDQCYITNSVFCRSAGNRPPSPEETFHCLSYHKYEFNTVSWTNTKFVFPLGNNALFLLTGMVTSVFYVQGTCFMTVYNGQKIFIFPILHPGSIIRKTTEKQKLFTLLSEIRIFIGRRGFATKGINMGSIV